MNEEQTFHVKHSKQPAQPALAHLADELDALARAGLRRTRKEPPADGSVSFCSNDYLGLASRPVPGRAPAGSGASRLVDGERAEHRQLERAMAAWLEVDDALLFTSGYAANVGVVSALASADDLIVSDALNHASLIDGARLSRASVDVVAHCDVDAVERALAERGRAHRRRWVVTESYFSMDADGPDLRALRNACNRYDAGLVVDEAHALGVLGPGGRGLAIEAGVRPDVTVGTFGKSFGAGGAFVAGASTLIDWLWNRARSFVFSTGLSPAVAAAALANLIEVQANPDLQARALANTARLREGFAAAGFPALGFGPILPVVLGDPVRAVAMATALTAAGIPVQAIRPPSVAPGTSRLRFTASAAQSPADVERAIAAVAALGRLPREA